MATTTFTVTSVTKDSPTPGSITVVGTYTSATTHTAPAQQVTVLEVPSENAAWSRMHRITSTAFWCARNGADSFAMWLTSFSKIARTMCPSLTWSPKISAQPEADTTTFAKATLTVLATTLPTDGQNVVLGVSGGSKTYVFKDTLSVGPAVPNEVKIDAVGGTTAAKVANTLDNLKAAVNGSAGEGTTYGTGTVAHTQIDATTNTDTTQLFVSKTVGTTPNTYVSTTTWTSAAFGGTVFSGGVAAAVFTVVATSEDSGSQTYVWQAEDVTTYAAGTLTSDTVAPADGDTVTIGNKTYTFKTALTASTTPNEVLIAGSAANALDNLKHAIDNTGTPGTDYGSETLEHTQVNGSTLSATSLVVVAVTAGDAANLYATTENSDHLSWGDPTLINGGWATATGTINGCAYSGGTTFQLTCTPTTTGQTGVLHRCQIRNVVGTATNSSEVALTIT